MATGPRLRASLARTAWDRSSDVWEDFQEAGKDFSRDRVHGPALLRAVGRVKGLRVLDLGCGQGRFTRALAQRGANVTGMDWSARMIAFARRHEREDPLGIVYRHRDARRCGSGWKRGSFDLVVGCMSLMDMPEVPRVLRGAHRLLRPRGRLVFSVSHPLNTAAVGWERLKGRPHGAMRIDRYFQPGPRLTDWNMPRLKRPFQTICWHRTFEDWFSLLRRAGFEVVGLREPRASERDARANPLLAGTRRVPFFLVFDCRRVNRR